MSISSIPYSGSGGVPTHNPTVPTTAHRGSGRIDLNPYAVNSQPGAGSTGAPPNTPTAYRGSGGSPAA